MHRRLEGPPRLDFRFTRDEPDEARRRIEADLTEISQRLIARDPWLVALVLTGGFSRGEGTVRDDAPVNDYDIIALRSVPGGRARYAKWAHELTAHIGIEVDVMPIWQARLPFVSPSLFWHDLALGGKVLVGDERSLKPIPRRRPEDLAKREVARLLGNRAAGLLRCVPGPGAPRNPQEEHLQATKAALAALDARLLASGRYAPALTERLALARDLPDADVFARAVEWKLASREVWLGPHWWQEARDALLRAVDDTGARHADDGAAERVFHLIEGRRWMQAPSHALRVATWDILAQTECPEGPRDVESARQSIARVAPVRAREWPELKARFFEIRAQTLQ